MLQIKTMKNYIFIPKIRCLKNSNILCSMYTGFVLFFKFVYKNEYSKLFTHDIFKKTEYFI